MIPIRRVVLDKLFQGLPSSPRLIPEGENLSLVLGDHHSNPGYRSESKLFGF
jgi:hypothetical protein